MRRSRRTLALLVGPVLVLTAAGLVASALTPFLAAHHPLLLISLDARSRNLVLARHVDLLPFVVVGTLRRLVSDPLYFLLGRTYGDGAVRWLEKQAGGGTVVRTVEELFHRAGYLMVFLIPGPVVCALAGATAMPVPGFVVLNVAGTVATVFALRLFGQAASGPVDDVLGFFSRHALVTTAASVALVVVWVVLQRKQGREPVSVEEVAEELESDTP